jgi:predicted MFS family arabinose efflux permease
MFAPSFVTGYPPEEKAKAQGANEIVIFTVQAVSAFSSGVLVNARGWNTLNYVALPLVGLAAVALAWLALRRRQAQPA